MINKKRLVRLVQDLLKTRSENPPGDETAVAKFVAGYLKKIGLAPRIIRFAPRRDNVLAVLKGGRSRGSLLLTPHLDTVPAGKGWKYSPFSGHISRGRIYGRGATDCKGNAAVSLEVLTSLVEDGVCLRRDVIWLGTADEETGSAKGLIPFLEKGLIRSAHALILDSDDFNVIVAQKGLIHFKVEVFGRRAHGAYPERGVSAIDGACRLIAALKKMRFQFRPHRLLKPPTVNIGTIRGGDKVNMVADRCVFEVDLRFLPGMRSGDILIKIKEAFRRKNVKFALTVNDVQQPYEISPAHPMVAVLQRAGRAAGAVSVIRGSEGATVITFFRKEGIPAVATGWGASGCAHASDEYARVDDLVRGARALEKFIKMFDAALP